MKSLNQTPKTAIEAPKSEPATPKIELSALVSAFNEANSALAAAETALRTAAARATDLELQAVKLDSEAAEADAARGRFLARGEMDSAKESGQRFAAAHDAAKSARLEAGALRSAIPALECDVLNCEDAARQAHAAAHRFEYERCRADLLTDLSPRLLRLWRLYLASGWSLTFEDFARQVAHDAAPGGEAYSLPLPEPLPVQEAAPHSELIGSRRSDRRFEIRERLEAMQKAA